MVLGNALACSVFRLPHMRRPYRCRRNVAFLRPASSLTFKSAHVFWAFAAVILITLLTITVSNRGIVRVIGSVTLVGLLIFGVVYRLSRGVSPDPESTRGTPSSPASAIAAIPLDAIKVEDLKLTGSGAPFELRGTIQNSSEDTRIRSFTLRIVRRDCFEGAIDPSGCVVIWQDQHWVSVNVPPESERKFASSFYAHTTVPRARGTIRDEFKLVAATGGAVTP
jgi:hypothetical protein